MNIQFGMCPVAPSNDPNLIGLAITLPEQCPRCNGHNAVTGAGRWPHKASLMCCCGRHLGWMSVLTFNFIAEAARKFGRPSEPISVTRKPPTTMAEAKSSSLLQCKVISNG